MSNLESEMDLHLRILTQERPYLAGYEREYKFCPSRRWRFDFAWPELKMAIEVEGGQWTNGRHQRSDGFEKDCEKYNTAVADGWAVYRFTGDMVKDGRALAFLESVMVPF